MRWTNYFIPTSREIPVGTEAASHQLLLRAGLVNMLTAGVYSYLPLGLRVLNRIETIICEEMDAAGAHKLFLPCLQPIELWQKTGRDEILKDVMIRFEDRRKRQLCLGPTHEEVITQIVKEYTQSYRQLPVVLYQIQTKFRDEARPRFGIVRACEFIMKDAYSFDRDREGLQNNYRKMFEAYNRIFKRCGLKPAVIEADSGAMGGDVSHEYLVPAAIGEDEIMLCGDCGSASAVCEEQAKPEACPQCQGSSLLKQVAIEIGHIFQLGTKYSAAQGAMFLDEDGRRKPIIMGCYGIGVSRLIAAIIETNHDENGIIWPDEVAPFDIALIPLQTQEEDIRILAETYYDELKKEGYKVLLDDRAESAGVKLNDADLIGLPRRIVIGRKKLKEDKVEIKDRGTGEVRDIGKDMVVAELKRRNSHHENG